MTAFVQNHILLLVMVLGIFVTKVYWISTELRVFTTRKNWNTLQTNIIEVVLLLLQILGALFFPLPSTIFDPFIIGSGIILFFGGMILAFWGRITMKSSWGIPGTLLKEQKKKLITSGPFAFTRNPIYLGFTGIYIGFSLSVRSWLIFLRFPLLFYFYKAILSEERVLHTYFGKKYQVYMRTVPRFLFL